MNTFKTIAATAVAAVALVTLGGCANMTPREKDIAVGAGVGAAAGSVLSGGSALGTLGGAAAGGIIGNEVSKDRR